MRKSSPKDREVLDLAVKSAKEEVAEKGQAPSFASFIASAPTNPKAMTPAERLRDIARRLECATYEDDPLEALMQVVKEDSPVLRSLADWLDGRVVVEPFSWFAVMDQPQIDTTVVRSAIQFESYGQGLDQATALSDLQGQIDQRDGRVMP